MALSRRKEKGESYPMSEQLYKRQDELAKLIERYSGQDGNHSTAIPALFFTRLSNAAGPKHGVYNPSLCIIVQGAKEVLLGKERFTYSPADYLIASVNLPVTAQVVEASPTHPYLAFKLEFKPSEILEVLRHSQLGVDQKEKAKRGMYVSPIDSFMLDAVIRLVRLLDNPKDIPVLAPLFKKEILYRVLQGPHGAALKQMTIEGSSSSQIGDVVEHIMKNFDTSFRIEDLAEIANMSVSSLHRHFKEVTAMSPVQFQSK